MPENRRRLVPLCQRGLALGVMLALVAPAATVTDLDLGAPTPPGAAPDDPGAAALVAAEPVQPEVTEEVVRGVEREGLRELAAGSAQQRARERLAALSAPEPVEGYATVGVTWDRHERLDESDISVSVRTRTDGDWSAWQEVPYDGDHGPDPGSVEARRARQGTDPIVVGDVDDVQVKAVTGDGEAPEDLALAVVDPGDGGRAVQQPAIDTGAPADGAAAGDDGAAADEANLRLSASGGGPTPKPRIFSRAQWGADERLRDKSSLRYYEVHAGFVHHTVNANGYTRAQVPSLIRGIYAYHTQSLGWSDIGYNFVVDKFGRIWEGRYGGVDRPVVGAHTYGYNDYSFAMSALGNFETAAPRSAMLDAYGRLFAWKLSLHGVDVTSTRQRVGDETFPAINGHRDAGQTACPGRYLYARIPRIRTLAAGYQRAFDSRRKTGNVSGSKWPDLVVRDSDTGRVFVVRTGGQVRYPRSHVAASRWGRMDLLTPAGDMTGDGRPDMLGRDKGSKELRLYPGRRDGKLGAAVRTTRRFSGGDQLTGGTDLTGEGRPDTVMRAKGTKRLFIYPGNRNGGWARRRLLSADWSDYNLTVGVGDLDGDGRGDLVARSGRRLYLVPGVRGGIGKPVQLPGGWASFDLITGGGDVTNDGKSDIVVRRRRDGEVFVYPGDGRGGLDRRHGPYRHLRGMNYLAVAGQVTGNRRLDLVGRNGRGRLIVYRNNGRKNIARVVRTNAAFRLTDTILNVGDWDGDGRSDVMTRVPKGYLLLHRGAGPRKFASPVRAGSGFRGVRLLTAVGDLTGDGNPDLLGQPKGGAMRIYPGNGGTGFKKSYVAHSAVSANKLLGVGLWDGDGSPDSVVRRSDGKLVLYPGNGPGGLLNPTSLDTGAGRYDWLVGVGDADGNRRPDVLARDRRNGTLWLLPGRKSGTGRRMFVGEGFDRFDLSG
jgi:hypothetical protein